MNKKLILIDNTYDIKDLEDFNVNKNRPIYSHEMIHTGNIGGIV